MLIYTHHQYVIVADFQSLLPKLPVLLSQLRNVACLGSTTYWATSSTYPDNVLMSVSDGWLVRILRMMSSHSGKTSLSCFVSRVVSSCDRAINFCCVGAACVCLADDDVAATVGHVPGMNHCGCCGRLTCCHVWFVGQRCCCGFCGTRTLAGCCCGPLPTQGRSERCTLHRNMLINSTVIAAK